MGMQDFIFSGEDALKRRFVLPKKILWRGNGVTGSEVLLHPHETYVFVGRPKAARLSNENGKHSGLLLDFGSELAGGIEIAVSGGISMSAGIKMHITFGESVSEAMSRGNEKCATNDHSVRDMTVVLPQWSQQTFGHTGYRFVYFELEEENSFVDLQSVRAVFSYRDLPCLGSFACDNETLNEIYKTCAYTVLLTMQNLLWDGIKRDRLVWIGDMYPEMLAIRTVFGDQSIIDESIKFIGTSNPLPRWPNNMTTYALWYLLTLWNWYWYNGRKTLVFELKSYWKPLLEQLIGLIHTGSDELLRGREFKAGFFFDWPTAETPEAKAGVYALFRLAFLSGARLCEMTEEHALKEQCLALAGAFKNQKPAHNDRKQIVAMLQFAGMMDDREAGEILTRGGGRGMSTFMSYFILSAAADTAGTEQAETMLEDYYGAMLKAGATTFWEDFDLDWMKEGAAIDKLPAPGEYDIHGDNGRFCYQGLRHSLCHGWSAGPAAFLAEKVLGIRILEAGCKKVSVEPNLGKLKWVKGTYPTPYGMITVEAKGEGTKIVKRVTVPEGIELLRESTP